MSFRSRPTRFMLSPLIVFALGAFPSAQITRTTTAPDISDRAARLVGKVTFVDPQHVILDSGTISVLPSITFASPQHVIIDSSASIAVTGSFYQATQPVSIASMPSTPVTGTFWQTTQPVSGTFWQTTQPITWNGTAPPIGAGTEAAALRVTLATDSTGQTKLTTGTAEVGNVKNSGTFAVQATTKTALTPSSPVAVSVGVTSAQAIASNASRKSLVCVNTSSNTISLGLAAAAVLSSGITLAPWGSWSMNEYSFATGAVNAIASGAASNLACQEFE